MKPCTGVLGEEDPRGIDVDVDKVSGVALEVVIVGTAGDGVCTGIVMSGCWVIILVVSRVGVAPSIKAPGVGASMVDEKASLELECDALSLLASARRERENMSDANEQRKPVETGCCFFPCRKIRVESRGQRAELGSRGCGEHVPELSWWSPTCRWCRTRCKQE